MDEAYEDYFDAVAFRAGSASAPAWSGLSVAACATPSWAFVHHEEPIYRSLEPVASSEQDYSAPAAKDAFAAISPSRFASFKDFAINWTDLAFDTTNSSPSSLCTRAPLPPTCPMFLEPNHYYTLLPLDEVCAALVRCGRHLHADLETPEDAAAANTFSYAFVAYVNHAEVCFALNVYVDDQSAAARHIVEIQRLCSVSPLLPNIAAPLRDGDQSFVGCGFSFMDVVRSAKRFLQDSGIIEQTATDSVPVEQSKSTTQLLPRVDDASVPLVVSFEVTLELVKNMLKMACSEFSDVQANALTTLAHLSSQACIQRAIVCLDGVGVLVALVQSAVPSVHRCALASLVNLVQPQACALDLVDQLVALGFVSHVQHLVLTSSVPHVLRECARALNTVCAQGVHISVEQAVVDRLERLDQLDQHEPHSDHMNRVRSLEPSVCA